MYTYSQHRNEASVIRCHFSALIGPTVRNITSYASRYRNPIEPKVKNGKISSGEIHGTNIGYRSADRCSLGVSRTRYLIIPRPLICLRRHTRHAMHLVDAAAAEPTIDVDEPKSLG